MDYYPNILIYAPFFDCNDMPFSTIVTCRISRKRFVSTFESSVDNVNAIGVGISDVLFHETSEAGQVSGYTGNAHDGALSWSVSPRLVVRGKDSHVTASHELLVVHGQQGTCGL
ncbi:hypothetical protein BpHYR1_002666 [Brachionus plicatilis]|uniref:Uncharacterized protein n=1 Tax=Brachionus plicatilis TaxID=10195 RepID=A0A3M7RMU4_BRAPC|nr:hypothetical protein BpHYR1_002666 [Brachionus plicatilis]